MILNNSILSAGHFLLTNLLLDKLKASAPSRVVIVASASHEHFPVLFDDLQSDKNFSPLKTYGASKSANILFGVHLAKELEGKNNKLYRYSTMVLLLYSSVYWYKTWLKQLLCFGLLSDYINSWRIVWNVLQLLSRMTHLISNLLSQMQLKMFEIYP